MIDRILLFFTVWLWRAKRWLNPPPPKEFFVQCERCFSQEAREAQITVRAKTIQDAMHAIPLDYLINHTQHRIGVFSADGNQDESYDWSGQQEH